MIIQPYEQWREKRSAEIDLIRKTDEDHLMSECDACEGDGELESRGIYKECPFCDGDGSIDDKEAMLDRAVYQKVCIKEIRSWCSWTRGDFLQAVGQFVRAERLPEYRTDQEHAA